MFGLESTSLSQNNDICISPSPTFTVFNVEKWYQQKKTDETATKSTRIYDKIICSRSVIKKKYTQWHFFGFLCFHNENVDICAIHIS